MPFKVKRVYDPVSEDDGLRVLVDRLWPRGLSKEAARIDQWLRDLAPSTDLRKWFHEHPDRWEEFEKRYFKELSQQDALIQSLNEDAAGQKVTLLFASKNIDRNNATALAEFLDHER
jgi:uncharacterized protein YeaO (DUF488 family)